MLLFASVFSFSTTFFLFSSTKITVVIKGKVGVQQHNILGVIVLLVLGRPPFVQNVQHLSALNPGLFHQSVDRLTRLQFVSFVFDVRQVDDDVVASRLNGRFQATGGHL